MIADGIHSTVSREEYDAIDGRINFSRLKLLAKSPAHYQANARRDSDAMKLGRAIHLAVLEPERFAAEVAIWTGDRRAGKAWDAFKTENEGKELLTEEEHRQAYLVAQAVRAKAQNYLGTGTPETTILWRDGEHACKGRVDWDGETALVDLKSTKDASPQGFGRQAHNLDYCAQAAFYSDGHLLATGAGKPFVLIAAEPEPPFVVQVYRVPESLIARGRAQYREWLERLSYCLRENWWPGYADGEVELSLPAWAMNQEIK